MSSLLFKEMADLVMASSWRRVLTGDGCPTLAHPVHGEPCHDSRGAWAEAHQLHVAGCDLPRRLLLGERVRLLDVGTAPGWNLAAAWSIAKGLPGRLDVTCIEESQAALRGGAEIASDPSWKEGAPADAVSSFERVHRMLGRAMMRGATGDWFPMGERVRVRLMEVSADAAIRELERDERFDAVFLDFFSPRVDPAAWVPEFLTALAGRVAEGGRLSTYTLSHPVRAALMAQGLSVGWAGARSGRRGGTWASRGGWVPPLSERLRARLERRSKRLTGSQGWAATAG